MRSLTLLVVTLLTSQFAFAGATVESTATVNTGTAEATLVRNEALADDPGNRPPAGTQLAFVRDDQIYLVNADGTGLAQLTNTGGGVANRDPAWSRDGQRLAFARGIPDGFGTWDIHIMDADGSNVVQVTSGGHNVEPAWGPDDRMIAFTFFSLLTGSAGVSVIDVDANGSQGSRVLLDFPGWDAQPAWSPDGQTITFTSDWRAYDFVYDLYVMKADGSNVRPLLEAPFFSRGTFYFQSAWSPDGQSLAVVVCPYAWDDCYPDSAIAVTNADGSGLRVIAEAGSYARPTWSPDGRWIAYGSSLCRTCPSSVRFVHVDGGTEGPIVDNGHSPAWRPEIAAPINAGLNDAWVSDDAPNQGFFFTVYPDLGLFFLSWFTFDSTLPDGDVTAEFGAPDQRWVTGAGFYSGDSVTVNVELTSGGIFNGSNPEASQQSNYGTITIQFINCNQATLTYNFPGPGLSGQMTLTRVLTDNVALCEELAAP